MRPGVISPPETERNPSIPTVRLYSIASTPATVPVFRLGVSAGFPSPALDHIEGEIDIREWLLAHPSATFMCEVEGDCLIDIGILDGDRIFVDKAGTARPGRVVLAVLGGDFSVKVIRRHRDKSVWLHSENERLNYPPLPLREGDEIWGVICGVIRRYDVS